MKISNLFLAVGAIALIVAAGYYFSEQTIAHNSVEIRIENRSVATARKTTILPVRIQNKNESDIRIVGLNWC